MERHWMVMHVPCFSTMHSHRLSLSLSYLSPWRGGSQNLAAGCRKLGMEMDSTPLLVFYRPAEGLLYSPIPWVLLEGRN